METVSSLPIKNALVLIHYLGAGKRICTDYGFHSYKCLLAQRGLSDSQYVQTYGYG